MRIYAISDGRCPPEDVGGTHGFEGFLEIMKVWYGSEPGPNQADPDQINAALVENASGRRLT